METLELSPLPIVSFFEKSSILSILVSICDWFWHTDNRVISFAFSSSSSPLSKKIILLSCSFFFFFFHSYCLSWLLSLVLLTKFYFISQWLQGCYCYTNRKNKDEETRISSLLRLLLLQAPKFWGLILLVLKNMQSI